MDHPIEDRRSTRGGERGRRRYPRVVIGFDGFYESERRMLMPRGGNLNLRGAFLQTAVPDPGGTEALFRLQLPDSVTLLRIPARVVWSNEDAGEGPVGMGLRFERLEGFQLKRLAAALLRRAGLGMFPGPLGLGRAREVTA